MKKNSLIKYLLLFTLTLTIASCDKYDDYITDYEYSAVYFGTQKPLRTLVTRASSDKVSFKLGAVLAGLRENTSNKWVTFELAPDLLTTVPGANAFTLMPSDWYTLSVTDNKFIIPKGKMLGDFTITIDKAKMAADPLALTKTYALPIRLLKTSADSILANRNYTIVVVKYISENSGTYYVRGKQSEYNTLTQDTVAGTTKKYYVEDWTRNTTRISSTLNLSDCELKGLGFDATAQYMNVTFAANKSVVLTTSSRNLANTIVDLGSTYDATKKEYHFVYSYVKDGKTYKVDEYLKQQNDPENDLRFEEW